MRRKIGKEKERRLKEFALDMNQSEPKNVNSEIIREILSYYKGGGKMYYDKAQEWFDDEADRYFAKHKGALEIILRERIRAEWLEKGLEEGKQEGLEEGKRKGIEEGREEGKLESLISLVKDGDLPLDKAIKRSGLSEEEFKKRLMNADKA